LGVINAGESGDPGVSAPAARVASVRGDGIGGLCARKVVSAKAAADLVPHILAEGFPARGPVFLVDIEAVEDIEIFKDRISIACHRQYAKQFAGRSARASDFPSAYRVGSVAGGEATQLRHVGSGQASADRLTEILAKLF
jgi:hypothetical protein